MPWAFKVCRFHRTSRGSRSNFWAKMALAWYSRRQKYLKFGNDWVDSCDGLIKKHAGLDVSAAYGEGVYAAESGTVREIVDGGNSWRFAVTIEHANSGQTFTTVYWHVDPLVQAGNIVSKGQKIATVADLQANTHFHLGIRNASYSNISNRGALPQKACQGDPAFPEYFINPEAVSYESNIPCHTITSSTPPASIPQGFGAPWNVFKPSELLLQAFCSASSVSVSLGNQNPLQYIYKTGYLNKPGSTTWTPISYASTEALISGAWYPKSANATLPMTAAELQNQSSILGYLCTWTGSAWLCGCRDQACTQSYWQIQGIHQTTSLHAVDISQRIPADIPPPPPPPPSPSLQMTLSLNQTAFRTGETLRVGLNARNPGSAFIADFYFAVLLPDGVTALFVTSLSPLNGVVTRLDVGPRTFRPLLTNVQLPQGLDVMLTDFLVYAFAGGEAPGTYTVFAVLTPPGAFNDGRVDPGDLLVIDARAFSFSP